MTMSHEYRDRNIDESTHSIICAQSLLEPSCETEYTTLKQIIMTSRLNLKERWSCIQKGI